MTSRRDPVLVAAVVFAVFGAVLFFAAKARATEGRWQLVECPPGQECRSRGKPLQASTACDLDAQSLTYVVATGTRVCCRRVADLAKEPARCQTR